MKAPQRLVTAGSYYHPRREDTGGGGATGPVAELGRPGSREEQHPGPHFHGACPVGPGQEGAEGPRSRPGTSGELSPQSFFLCTRGPLWLGPLFKGVLTFA